MDVNTLSKIIELADKYGTQTVITITCLLVLFSIIFWIGKFINKITDKFLLDLGSKHEQAMDKIEKLTDKLGNIAEVIVEQQAELKAGTLRFERIESDVKSLRENYHKINDIITREYLKDRKGTRLPLPKDH